MSVIGERLIPGPKTLGQRIRRRTKRLRARLVRGRLIASNLVSRRPVVADSGPAAVSLTTFGTRLGRVHLAIEAIGAGDVKPAAIDLWIDERRRDEPLPAPLRRLQRRGLRVHRVEDLGPHTKWFHAMAGDAERAVVLADDDVVYPPNWLADLVDAAGAHPGAVVCFRAHHVELEGDGGIAPYLRWTPAEPGSTDPLNFPTGVSGVLYPPAAQRAVVAGGRAFLEAAPYADDIWLHARLLAAGVPVHQLPAGPVLFPSAQDTARADLASRNVQAGGNDAQVAASYDPASLPVRDPAE